VAELKAAYMRLTTMFVALREESGALRDTAASVKAANEDLRARNAELRNSARSQRSLRAGPAPLARVRANQQDDPGR
jgi:hypothetical protein